MKRNKRTSKSVVLGILLWTVMYLLMTSVAFASSINLTHATGVTIKGSGDGSWTDGEGNNLTADSKTLTGSVTSTKDKDNNIEQKSETLTLKNEGQKAVQLSFDFQLTLNGGTVSFNNTSQTANGNVTYELQPGATYEIKLVTTNQKEATTTLKLSNFNITVVGSFTLHLASPAFGSYTATPGDGGTPVTVSSEDGPKDIVFDSTKGITLTMGSLDGTNHKFDRWENQATGAVLSYNNNFETLELSDGDTIVPSIIPVGYNRAFNVGTDKYYSWEDAFDQAKATGKPVVLNQDYTLPATQAEAEAAGEKLENAQYVSVSASGSMIYIVPDGVTFAIPYNDKLGTDLSCKNVEAPVKGSAYCTLTVKSGTEIKVKNGATFLINARFVSQNWTQFIPSGNYGRLKLGGTMTLENGAKLNARGYIVDTTPDHEYAQGDGRIYAMSGSEVLIPFEVMDFRNGSASYKTIPELMPMANYYISNIMVYTQYEYGAKLSAFFNIYISTGSMHNGEGKETIGLLSTEGTQNVLFTLSQGGMAAMDYDYDTDQLYVVAQKGNVNMQNIQFTLAYIYSVDTSKVIMPVADNMKLFVGDPAGQFSDSTVKVSIKYPIKLMPDASIHVAENGILDVESSGAIYLYSAKDYNPQWCRYNADSTGEWANKTYRLTLPHSENYTGGMIKLAREGDSAIYVAGTLNANGAIMQSGSAEASADKLNRIIPTAETAVLNLNKIATSATVKETPSTTGNIDSNTSWNIVDGLMAGGEGYEDFPTTGTYKVAKDGEDLKWYNYTATYKFQDVNGNDITDQVTLEQNPVYIVGNTANFDVSSIQNGRYAIVDCAVNDAAVSVAAADDGSGVLKPISEGCDGVSLGNVTKDIEVTLKVVPYDHRVTWNVKQGETTTTIKSYITGHSTTMEWEGSARVVVNSATPAGKVSADEAYVTEGSGEVKTVLPVTIAQDQVDVAIDLTVDMDYWRVDWNVTYPGSTEAVTKTEWIKKGDPATYTLDAAASGWNIIEDGAYSVTSNGTDVSAAVGVSNGRTFLALGSVQGATQVDITVSHYAHKVDVMVVSDAGETLTFDPVYVKESGGSAVIKNTAVKNAEVAGNATAFRYVFNPDEAYAPTITTGSAVPTVNFTDLTVANITADTTVKVTMKHYDYIVTIQDSESNLLAVDYVAQGAAIPTTYTFAEGIKINSVSADTDAAVAYTDATVDEQDNTKTVPASVTVTAVTADTTVTVSTSAFKHILTILDQDGNRLLQDYVNSDSTTYKCQNDENGRYIVTGASVTAGTGNAALDYSAKESISITNMTGNPTVVLNLTAYSNKVTWTISGMGNPVSTVDYLTEGRLTSSYEAPDKYIITDRSVTVSSGSTHGYVSDTLKKLEYGNINKDMSVTVTLMPYDYAVTIHDGGEPTVFYVDKDNPDVEVTYGDPIHYKAEAGKYITGLQQTGTANLDGSANINEDVTKGWEEFTITDVESDVTVDLTVGTYDHKVTWKIITTENNQSKTTNQVNFITGDTDSWYVGEEISILSATPSAASVNALISDDLHTVTVSGIESNITVTVNAQNFLFNIIWSVTKDGVTTATTQGIKAEHIEADGSVLWVMPSYDGDTRYVIGNVMVGYGEIIDRTNSTLRIRRTDSSQNTVTVSISIEEALDTYTALWGKMNYRYYKSGAYYAWDGDAFIWRLINTYSWTNTVGGRIEKYWDLNKNEMTQYFIPNCSVMIVNPTNVIVEATLTIADKASWATTTFKAEDGTVGTDTITVTLQPRTTMIISGSLSGDPQSAGISVEEMKDLNIGTWSVEITPTN